MFRKLKEAILGKPRPPGGTEFVHPQLGTFRFDEDTYQWEVEVEREGETVTLAVGGEQRPDEDLIQRALVIWGDLPRFKETLRAFLRAQAETRELKHWEEDIHQLQISSVDFSLNDSRGCFMVFFDGPDEYQNWKCGYVDGEPRHLGFDGGG